MIKQLISNSIKSSLNTNTKLRSIRSFGSACCGGNKNNTTDSKKIVEEPKIEEISIEDFFKVDLRVAKVISCEQVQGSKKLLKLSLDLGFKKQPKQEQQQILPTTETTETKDVEQPEQIKDIRTVYSGIKLYYEPDQLKGKNVIFVSNLKPREMKIGKEVVVSEGMVLCASSEDNKKVLYTTTDGEADPGMKVF
ncbi:hypothetical protein RB653_002375 [Dictyostelium firmibasis]|uniref:tRNA-binding domain-containing protein n=1 Tax=Dictyostelium firmibasis TaxID=79012 RepID=A0AAN7TQF3_9MYCE